MIAYAILIDMNYLAFALPYTFSQHKQPWSQLKGQLSLDPLSQLNQLIQGKWGVLTAHHIVLQKPQAWIQTNC